jgi:murein DD-endopeptidase MepM/ murein hydrolase activator NlpD
MSPENVRERKEKRRYTFIMVPDAKSQETRTVSVSRLGLLATMLAAFLLILALVFAAIVYTPLGTHLPLSSPELVKQYGKQIVDIQKQLHLLLEEVNVLRGYNVKLRRAMGENLARPDSLAQAVNRLDSAAGLPPLVNMGIPDSEGVEPGSTAAIYDAIDRNTVPGSGAEPNRHEMSVKFPLTMPAEGFMSRGFQPEQLHYGLDIAGKQGSPILAAADGVVIFAAWTYDDGFTLMMAHDEGFTTVYKHNQSLLKNAGERIRRGEMIALLGNTGRTSSGPHLHFEVWKDGVAQDPTNYLLTIQ